MNLKNGQSVSPFYLPLRLGVFIGKHDPFSDNFGVFNDSLPDGWGNLLLDRYLNLQKINPSGLTVLDRLSLVGSSGFGALEYKPNNSFTLTDGNPELNCIDLLEMFFGEVAKVSCFIDNNIHDYLSEDSAIVSLVFKNGAMGTVDSYFCIPDNSSKNILELYGSKGSIIANGTIGQGASGEMIAYLEDDNSGYNAQQARSASGGLILNPLPINAYLAEIEEFSSAIIEKRESENNFVRGLHSQKVLAACYLSAQTRKVVDVI